MYRKSISVFSFLLVLQILTCKVFSKPDEIPAAVIHEFPHQAVLIKQDGKKIECGAIIVNSDHLLTTATCGIKEIVSTVRFLNFSIHFDTFEFFGLYLSIVLYCLSLRCPFVVDLSAIELN